MDKKLNSKFNHLQPHQSILLSQLQSFLGVKDSMGVRLKVEDNYYTSKFYEPLTFKEGKVDGLKISLKKEN